MLQIAAHSVISLTEILTVAPQMTKEFFDANPEVLRETLYNLGIESYNLPVEEQFVQHRNRFGNVVTDWRWVGDERIDKAWTQSGHASRAAIDKSLNNRILTDSYASRGEVEVV